MPTAMHPQAKFDPLPPDFDLYGLVDGADNFDWVVRISINDIRRLGPSGFEKLVQLHVIDGGRPLVIEGWDRVLPKDMFSAEWLEKNYDKKQENVRDLNSQANIPMTTGHYLRSMRQLANQWSPTNYKDERRQRLYLKDIDCPPEWHDHLKKTIPPNVFYMNDNINETPGGSQRSDDIFGAPENSSAVAGDLMSCLPAEMRAENLMCYVGHEGTYTPAHKEMCGTLGQNIMVEASSDENGEKAGSSIWFMTESKDMEVVREYFLSMLGHDIEIEKHFAQVNAWKKATFPVYVVEQKVGDFILIPPLAPHQVWNRGTRTMKVAWNRITVETIGLALYEALPRSRLVCRDEQYKNKSIIYYALEKYYKELQAFEENSRVELLGLGQDLMQNSARQKQMAWDFRRLFGLFTRVLIDEMFAYKQSNVEFIPYDSNITCSYCRSNIFNRFLTCKCCVRLLINGDEDTYDICMECYAMGRSCVCISGLQWCEQWPWDELMDKYEAWRAMIIKQDGFVDIEISPQPLEVARRKLGKKCVAQICQEQLKRRPWNDITKPPEAAAPESEPEPEVDDEGRVKKKPKSRRKPKKGELYRCHVCCHKDNIYKLNYCTTCQEAYCYGVLWRAFDTMPQDAMEQEHWQCPRCRNICNCGACRRAGTQTAYIPKNTLLGHDTRHVADDRSVESIVDFRIHNLNWLKAAGEDNRSRDTKRMQRLRQQADAEKAKDPLNAPDEDAPDDPDAALQDSIINGFGDQSHIGKNDGHDSASEQAPNHNHDHGMQVETAPMDTTMDEGDSIYPDLPDDSGQERPLMSGARMMGMGFYQQDDSQDKILFEAFQMPSADALNNEPQMSEFVKKTLRQAKRKARLETDDDPDFKAPSHYRKKPKTGNIDQLVNLDPALLGALGGNHQSDNQPGDVVAGPATAPDASEQGAETTPAEPGPSNQQRPGLHGLPVDPLNPTLRHAKPIRSYVDAEDPAEDPDDIVIRKPKPAPNEAGTEAEDPTPEPRDPIDLAADAIRSLIQPAKEPIEVAEETPPPKRRGRPPRNSLQSASAESPPTTDTKKRGRPPGRKSNLFQVETQDEAAVDEGTAKEDEISGARRPGRGRGRPSGQGINANADTSTPATPDDSRSNRLAARNSTKQTKPEAAPVDSTPQMSEPPKDERFMSMAERMALKGKKVKIGERKSKKTNSQSTPARPLAPTTPSTLSKEPDSATVTPATLGKEPESTTGTPATVHKEPGSARGRGRPRKQTGHNSLQRTKDSTESKSSSSVSSETETATSSTRPKKPMVVRLDMDESNSDSDSVSSDSGGYKDPSPRKRYVATRGRGRGRGGMARRGRPV